jgi:hypothetical protein
VWGWELCARASVDLRLEAVGAPPPVCGAVVPVWRERSSALDRSLVDLRFDFVVALCVCV